jgi:ribonuclease HI
MIAHTECKHGRSGVLKGTMAWEKSRGQENEISRRGAQTVEYSYSVEDSQYDPYAQTWICRICSRSFRSKSGLEQHLNAGVHEMKRYDCKDCGRGFVSMTALMNHLSMTGHSRREQRLIGVMTDDAKSINLPLLTDGRPRITHEATLKFDGSSRGNPGHGGSGYVLYDHNNREITRGGRYLGSYITNNQAEYCGLIDGLSAAVAEGIKRLKVEGDSELVIKQMKKEYAVSSPSIVQLYVMAAGLCPHFHTIDFEALPRELNADADALATHYSRGP